MRTFLGYTVLILAGESTEFKIVKHRQLLEDASSLGNVSNAHFYDLMCRHLRNIENGAKAPSYDILLTISELFSVSTDYLLKGNEHTYSDLKRRLESVMRDLEEIHDGIPV